MTAPADEALTFAASAESMRRALGASLTPALKAELRSLGIDFDRPRPAFPLDDWEAMVRRVAVELFPGLPEAEQWRRLGHRFIRGYAETTIGAAVMTMAKVIGTRRALERMGRNIRTLGNFNDCEAVIHGDRDVELVVTMLEPHRSRRAGRPTVLTDYRVGVFEGAFELLGVKGTVEITERNLAEQRMRFRLRWE